MFLSELQQKDMVSISNGKRLGKIIDAKIDNNGNIIHFVVEEKKLFRFFSSSSEFNVTFKQIIKIGEDVILVEI